MISWAREKSGFDRFFESQNALLDFAVKDFCGFDVSFINFSN
jgi:hypothetical protein